MLARLARLRPFALQEAMLPAANLQPRAQIAIEGHLRRGRAELQGLVEQFLAWLASGEGRAASAAEAQRRFSLLRVRFNTVLTHFDLFSDIVTQRSENETGVWLAGLDVASADALRLRARYFEEPAMVCYLDRGMGAAIRRARTRLPTGGENPVAVVRVPRERMVGMGIASSLFHEVGHQAAALLALVEGLRPELAVRAERRSNAAAAWRLWARWSSEVVADFWSVARVGVAATLGLISVVSLPRAFVSRVGDDDPHPAPWSRVKLSAAVGEALYPQPLWQRLHALWESYYPRQGLGAEQRRLFDLLEHTLPEMVGLLLQQRPSALGGASLVDALETRQLEPARLTRLLRRWRHQPSEMYTARPIVAFAALGQGRALGDVSPEEESVALAKLLTHWALRSNQRALGNDARTRSAHAA